MSGKQMDIVEKLRYFVMCGKTLVVRNMCAAAADEIQSLREELDNAYDRAASVCSGIGAYQCVCSIRNLKVKTKKASHRVSPVGG